MPNLGQIKNLRRYNLEGIVFLCGAVVMVFELVGSRVMAPYLGTSIFVWTSLIGVILGSLSLGYYLGGKLADKNPSLEIFSYIILSSGIFIAFVVLIKDFALFYFQNIPSIELASLVSSLIIFFPASFALGMVSPYVVKLKLSDMAKSGSTVGNLYAISTVGSIFGTFFAGFFLIPLLGSAKILISLSISLALASLLISKKNIKIKILLALALIAVFISAVYFDNSNRNQGIIDIETKYNRLLIFSALHNETGRKIRVLSTDNYAWQSAIFLEGEDDLVFGYTKFYRLAGHFAPGLKKSLAIGGAGYTYPRDYLKKYPSAEMDVVEIDEKMTEAAKKYFRLEESPRLNIYHEDGRTFLNKTDNNYDVIFGDAFQSLTIPYQLTTKEAVSKIYGALNDDGVVMVNIISSIEGKKGKFLRAEYRTFKSVFPQVYLFPVTSDNPEKRQNIILVALKSENIPEFKSDNGELDGYLKRIWKGKITEDLPVLTDDFAPVDYYIRELL